MRFVLDTDVVVAGMRRPPGASAALLRQVDEGPSTLVLSVALALGYEAKCRLPEHRAPAGLTEAEVTVFLDGLVALADPVRVFLRWRPQLRDPGDEMVLEAAVNGQAAAIVSFNRRDYGSAPARFGLALLSPAEARRRIEV